MRIVWEATGIVEQGVDRGVLYLSDGSPVPWDGLVTSNEHPDDVVQTDLYYDGVRFGFAQSLPDFSMSVEAWTYPSEFDPYQGFPNEFEDKQPRRPFGFSWRNGYGDGHKLHLVWNVMALPNEKPYSSRNNELEISLFTWEFVTNPKKISGVAPSSHIVIDTNFAPEDAVEALEDLLYGTVSTTGGLPEPQEVIDLFLDHAILVVTDNGDGTCTVTGPDEAISMLTADKVRITWPSVRYTDTPGKVNIRSL